MKLSPYLEADSCAEYSNTLWNPNVHYRVQKVLHWSLTEPDEFSPYYFILSL
jgi:hypothetical protein